MQYRMYVLNNAEGPCEIDVQRIFQAEFTALTLGTRTETVEINVGEVNSEYAGGYYCNDAQQINILLIGRTQTGKSTIVEALKNPEYQQSNTGFSTTSNPECYRNDSV